MQYIGLDLGKVWSHATVLDQDGGVVERRRLLYDSEVYRKFFAKYPQAHIVIESCSLWMPVYDLLTSLGHRVSVADPRHVKLIAKSKIKTDAIDSCILAQLLRTNYLPTIWVPPMEGRELRHVLHARYRLGCIATRFKNQIRGELLRKGMSPPADLKLWTREGREWLTQQHSEHIDRALRLLVPIEHELELLDTQIEREAQKYDDSARLRAIYGVGPFVAMAVIAVFGDASRFPTEKHACSYVGVVTSTRQSSDRCRRGHITKEGSPLLRWALSQAAHVHVRLASKQSPVRQLYQRVCKRHGKGKAIVAVMRVLLAEMWKVMRYNRMPDVRLCKFSMNSRGLGGGQPPVDSLSLQHSSSDESGGSPTDGRTTHTEPARLA